MPNQTRRATLPLPAWPADLKPLYRSKSKAALLGQLFERLAASLEQSGTLPPLQGAEGGEQQQQPAPQALVWCAPTGSLDVTSCQFCADMQRTAAFAPACPQRQPSLPA